MAETDNVLPAGTERHELIATGLKKRYGSRQVVKGVDLSVKLSLIHI